MCLNSRTNSFFKIDDGLYYTLEQLRDAKSSFKVLDKDTLASLKHAKILVNRLDDEYFFNQRKYLKYKKCLSKTDLGIVIAPTMACNFACPYCYEAGLPLTKMSLSVQNEILDFIKSFSNTDSVNITWHGGEPLMAFEEMKNILAQIFNYDGISVNRHNLVTNGYLLSKEVCIELKRFKLDYLQITIDGLEKSHNASRVHKSGLPTYKKIIENIDCALEILNETRIIVRVNIHKKNENDFHKLYKELSTRWNSPNVRISPHFTTEYEGCKIKCLKMSDRVGFYKDLYYEHNIKDVEFYLTPKNVACTADFDKTFIIGSQGELYKCWVDLGRKERVVGHISSNEFNHELLSEYMMGTDIFNDPKCSECPLFPVCDGGCNLFRYEFKLTQKEYNVCPIDIDDLPKLLELHYEQQMNKANV